MLSFHQIWGLLSGQYNPVMKVEVCLEKFLLFWSVLDILSGCERLASVVYGADMPGVAGQYPQQLVIEL